MANSVRIERMLRELHSEPPLRFLEDAFSMTEFALARMMALREAAGAEEAARQDSDQALTTFRL